MDKTEYNARMKEIHDAIHRARVYWTIGAVARPEYRAELRSIVNNAIKLWWASRKGRLGD